VILKAEMTLLGELVQGDLELVFGSVRVFIWFIPVINIEIDDFLSVQVSGELRPLADKF
jgi:hypothetical protein